MPFKSGRVQGIHLQPWRFSRTTSKWKIIFNSFRLSSTSRGVCASVTPQGFADGHHVGFGQDFSIHLLKVVMELRARGINVFRAGLVFLGIIRKNLVLR